MDDACWTREFREPEAEGAETERWFPNIEAACAAVSGMLAEDAAVVKLLRATWPDGQTVGGGGIATWEIHRAFTDG